MRTSAVTNVNLKPMAKGEKYQSLLSCKYLYRYKYRYFVKGLNKRYPISSHFRLKVSRSYWGHFLKVNANWVSWCYCFYSLKVSEIIEIDEHVSQFIQQWLVCIWLQQRWFGGTSHLLLRPNSVPASNKSISLKAVQTFGSLQVPLQIPNIFGWKPYWFLSWDIW